MIFDRIFVPLDGSKSGEVALSFLKRLPLKDGAHVILARIVEPGPKDPGPGFVEESLQFAEGYLRQVVATLAEQDIAADTFVRSDRVIESLVSAAAEMRATLILMATHGRTASSARPFGGVAEQLIRTSPVPILAVPSFSRAALELDPKEAGRPIRTILVTTDGSDYADAIVPLAADMAAACGSAVILLELVSSTANEYRASNQLSAAEEHLKVLERTFKRRGVSTERVTGRARPVAGILDLARRRDVDLIAMSTHGGAPRCDSVVGSVTQTVLQQAGIPVLMTRTCPAPIRPGERRKVARPRRR